MQQPVKPSAGLMQLCLDAEVQPLETRAAAASVNVTINSEALHTFAHDSKVFGAGLCILASSRYWHS